jgi:thymidylate synthase
MRRRRLIKSGGEKIDDFKFEDFKLVNHGPHPGIKSLIAV